MSDEEEIVEVPSEKPRRPDGQVTLAQMLKVLDKDVASGVEKRLKKLSKKKSFKPVINEQEVEQLNRKSEYEKTVQELGKWDPVVEYNRSTNLSFPLDVQPDHLPTTAESLSNLKPRNDLEKEVQLIIKENMEEEAKKREAKKAEERYQKAISVEEAKERHLEMQKARLRLNEFAAKMRRQNKIKSKSYHRLLKHERIRKHIKRAETNKDALMDEIERLQKIRAQERATLKHKNTGKWAKHAKFRAKYDEEARKLMLEQIGIASKRLERPAMPESDSDETSDESDVDEEMTSQSNNVEDDETEANVILDENDKLETSANARLIISSDLISDRSSRKRKKQTEDKLNVGDDDDDYDDDEDDNDDDEQRRLMSEAFADDDVVGEFEKVKDQIENEEQPKDINTYLPGWGDWAGPGIAENEKKRQRFTKKAPKIVRRDRELSNVIISEKANASIKKLQLKKLPRGIRNDDHLKKVMSRPVTATFTDQTSFRERIQPKIVVRMGSRIEPINKSILAGSENKADWA